MSAAHAHDHEHGGLHPHGTGSGSLRSLTIALVPYADPIAGVLIGIFLVVSSRGVLCAARQ